MLAGASHLPERGLDYYGYRDVLDIGGFLITHGEAFISW